MHPITMRPHEVVAALIGRDAVTIGGYLPEAAPLPWLRLDRTFISASPTIANADEVSRIALQRRTAARALATSTLILALLAALVAGIAIAPAVTPASPQLPSPLRPLSQQAPWHVIGIETGALITSVGGIRVSFAPGDRLPNGDLLQALMPMQAAYITDKSTVVISGLRSTNTPRASQPTP